MIFLTIHLKAEPKPVRQSCHQGRLGTVCCSLRVSLHPRRLEFLVWALSQEIPLLCIAPAPSSCIGGTVLPKQYFRLAPQPHMGNPIPASYPYMARLSYRRKASKVRRIRRYMAVYALGARIFCIVPRRPSCQKPQSTLLQEAQHPDTEAQKDCQLALHSGSWKGGMWSSCNP